MDGQEGEGGESNTGSPRREYHVVFCTALYKMAPDNERKGMRRRRKEEEGEREEVSPEMGLKNGEKSTSYTRGWEGLGKGSCARAGEGGPNEARPEASTFVSLPLSLSLIGSSMVLVSHWDGPLVRPSRPIPPTRCHVPTIVRHVPRSSSIGGAFCYAQYSVLRAAQTRFLGKQRIQRGKVAH